MSNSVITVAIIGTALIILMIVFLVQMRQRMSDDKVRQINALGDHLRRMRRMLDDLPASYIQPPIRVRILERIMEVADELKGLDRSHDYSKDKAQAAAELALVQQKPLQEESSQAIIRDEQQALEIRKLLKLLLRFIEAEKHDGRLDAKVALQNMHQTAFLIARSLADLFVSKAHSAEAAGKHRVAIDQYHSAIEAMEKAQGSPLAQQCVLQYRKKIKELDKLASEELAARIAVEKPVVTEDENGNKLSEQWDRLMSEEDKWKKKQAYDD